MVFSQTSLNTQNQNILKVVDIDCIKVQRNQQANGSRVNAGGNTGQVLPSLESPAATTSFSEVYLKTEIPFESKMFHDPDSEFFQDLGLLCFEHAKEELALTTDSTKDIDASAHNTDTLHTPNSPQGYCWEFNATSTANGGFYNSTPSNGLSPAGSSYVDTLFEIPPGKMASKKENVGDKVYDIRNLPVVLGDLASEEMVDLNPCYAMDADSFDYTYNTENTKTQKMLLMDDEDSLEQKMETVMPRDVHNNNVVISEYIINNDRVEFGVEKFPRMGKRAPGLSLDLNPPQPIAAWDADIISTPEVLSYVEQLEKEKSILPSPVRTPEHCTTQDLGFDIEYTTVNTPGTSLADYEPVTPKTEPHVDSDVEVTKSYTKKKRHRECEDSDETYTPYAEHTPRKYKRRKQNIPIKDMIVALEGSQKLPKARRGRPPKRRESTVSSVCSIDDSASTTSTHEGKYRELRDKNNEASKRSRMHRKLKELQMEQLAIELEERNKKLTVKANILEDMTKKLKDALMTAILQK